MTTRFIYKCNNCNHEYSEQRPNEELLPYFSICHSCTVGEYEEINKDVLSEETERSPGPMPTAEEVVEPTITE
jgi:peptide subunit release factor 1 (eRF1)